MVLQLTCGERSHITLWRIKRTSLVIRVELRQQILLFVALNNTTNNFMFFAKAAVVWKKVLSLTRSQFARCKELCRTIPSKRNSNFAHTFSRSAQSDWRATSFWAVGKDAACDCRSVLLRSFEFFAEKLIRKLPWLGSFVCSTGIGSYDQLARRNQSGSTAIKGTRRVPRASERNFAKGYDDWYWALYLLEPSAKRLGKVLLNLPYGQFNSHLSRS